MGIRKESSNQTKILKFLKAMGAYSVRTIKASKGGVADIICCYRGYFVAFEIKDEKGEVSPLQEYNIKLVRKSGGRAAVVVTVEDVKKVLELIDG